MKGIDGVILAGGESSRFGSDKAKFMVDGQRMIDRALHALRPHTDVVWLSAGDSNEDYGLNLPILRDPEGTVGPLAGLLAGLQASRQEWIAVLPCDMPEVDAEAVSRLVDARRGSSKAIVAGSSEEILQPVFACYHRGLLPLMRRNASAGLYSLRDLLGSVKDVVTVEFPQHILLNANFRDDLAED